MFTTIKTVNLGTCFTVNNRQILTVTSIQIMTLLHCIEVNCLNWFKFIYGHLSGILRFHAFCVPVLIGWVVSLNILKEHTAIIF